MISLADLTPDQRARICNGCGAKAGPFSFIKPPKGHDSVVCDQHDLVSWIGGLFWSLARWRADWGLLIGLLKQAPRHRWWQVPGFVAKSFVFWLAVRLGGWASFHYGPPRTAADLPKPRVLAAELNPIAGAPRP